MHVLPWCAAPIAVAMPIQTGATLFINMVFQMALGIKAYSKMMRIGTLVLVVAVMALIDIGPAAQGARFCCLFASAVYMCHANLVDIMHSSRLGFLFSLSPLPGGLPRTGYRRTGPAAPASGAAGDRLAGFCVCGHADLRCRHVAHQGPLLRAALRLRLCRLGHNRAWRVRRQGHAGCTFFVVIIIIERKT